MLLADPEEIDSLVIQLSRYRFESIKSYLVSQNDSTTVRIRSYDPEAPKNVGSSPYFEAKYAIKENE